MSSITAEQFAQMYAANTALINDRLLQDEAFSEWAENRIHHTDTSLGSVNYIRFEQIQYADNRSARPEIVIGHKGGSGPLWPEELFEYPGIEAIITDIPIPDIEQ